MTLRERLLAGEHLRFKSWTEVAQGWSVNESTLRKVRASMKKQGHVIELAPSTVEQVGPFQVSRPETKWREVEAFDRGVVREGDGDYEVQYGTANRAGYIIEPKPHVFTASDFRNPEALPYVPPPSPMTRKLTREECPDGTAMLWISDVHIPIHNVPACDLAVDLAERHGVRRIIAGGDILDFNCLSRHKKQARRSVEHSTLLEEIEPGRGLLNWMATKETDYILGNHEGRLQSFIDENPIFHGSLLNNFAKVVDLPSRIHVVPQGGEVRLGNLSARHLDAEFKGGGGGKYPAQQVLDKLPDQSTIGGHVHRIGVARRTTVDEDGIKRTRCAWTMGHMSHEHEHYDYVSTSPNWQTGFGFIRVHWEGERPRFSVYQIEVLFDRYNRPYFEFGGHVYSASRKVAA